MNPEIKSIVKNQANAVDSRKNTTARLKRSLLLALGTFVPCVAAISYSVLHLEQTGSTEIKKISLLFSALSLPIYLIVLFLRNSIDARKDRKKISAMVTELTENISTEGTIPERQPFSNSAIKTTNAGKADALVKKIVQAING